MRRVQSCQGKRVQQGQQSEHNPFNPLQSYLIENYNVKSYVNTIANQRISYFLDKQITKEDETYRQMLRNQISTGVMNDDQFTSYLQKVTRAREQSEIDVIKMRKEQIKTDQMVKSAKNLKPKNAIKHVKITQEEFAINNCAQITDQEELKKQIKQLVHVNKIKNFVQRINNKKQIKYLNKALSEIKESHNKRTKPIKYIINENKDPRALLKPLRMPITDYKVVKIKQKPLNITDDLTINFFDYQSKPHTIIVPKRTAEQEKIRENEIITNLGFKIRQTSEISVVRQLKNTSPSRQDSPHKYSEPSNFFSSRRKRNIAREQGLILDNEIIEKIAKEEMVREQEYEDSSQQKDEEDNLFVTSAYNPILRNRNLGSTDLSTRPIQSSKFQQQYIQEIVSPKEMKNSSQKFSTTNNNMSNMNLESAINSQKEIILGHQLSLTQSQVRTIQQQKAQQPNRVMNQLIDQMNDYQQQNNTKNITNQINKFQNQYDKLASQHFDKEQQQQLDLEQTLRDPEKKYFQAKRQKSFLR